MSLQGGKLAGGNPASSIVENDFYATDPKAVLASFSGKYYGRRSIERRKRK